MKSKLIKIDKRSILNYLTRRINVLEKRELKLIKKRKRKNQSWIEICDNFRIALFELKVMRAKIEGKIRKG